MIENKEKYKIEIREIDWKRIANKKETKEKLILSSEFKTLNTEVKFLSRNSHS